MERAGMTDREGLDVLDSIKRINDCRIRQPGFEVRDLPVLNHCFIRNAFWETDYPGQQ
jgi:hypothetical protein